MPRYISNVLEKLPVEIYASRRNIRKEKQAAGNLWLFLASVQKSISYINSKWKNEICRFS